MFLIILSLQWGTTLHGEYMYMCKSEWWLIQGSECYPQDLNFNSRAEKDAFIARLTNIRQCLIPLQWPLVDNHKLMLMLFDQLNTEATHTPTNEQPTTKSFLCNSCQEIHSKWRCERVYMKMICLCTEGVYTGDDDVSTQQHLILPCCIHMVKLTKTVHTCGEEAQKQHTSLPLEGLQELLS